MSSRSSSLRIFGLSCIVLVLLVGPFPIMDFLYRIGLYPQATGEQVVAALKSGHRAESATCEPDVAGWEFVCDYTLRQSDGVLRRHRTGVRTSWLKAIRGLMPLPVDGPILSEEENTRRSKEEYAKLMAPVNLRTATVKELQKIPLVDQFRAEQIHKAVKEGVVTKVDDLLKVKGIDAPTLQVMRSRAYWQ